jgi:esterase/lipase
MTPSFLKRPDKPDLAYVYTPPKNSALPVVVFLGGFKSDMSGTKAGFLEAQCQISGQGFMRFDYSGHGMSGGVFKDGTISQWKEDVMDILSLIPSDRIILIGSSMGGWLSLSLLSGNDPRMKGFIGIAAAPDFTVEVERRLTDAQRREMHENGYIEAPNDYSDEPYIFTKALLEDGRKNFVLGKKHHTNAHIVLIQGKMDADVPWETVNKIKEHFTAPSFDIKLVEDGDHSMSRQEDLIILADTLERMNALISSCT